MTDFSISQMNTLASYVAGSSGSKNMQSNAEDLMPIENSPETPKQPTEPEDLIPIELEPAEPKEPSDEAKQAANVLWNVNLMQAYYDSQTSVMENYMFPDEEDTKEQRSSAMSISEQYLELLKLRRELTPEQKTDYSLYELNASNVSTLADDSNSIVSIKV